MEHLKIGTSVKINQGFGVFTLGKIISFDNTKRNSMGFYGNYQIEITGGFLTKTLKAPVGKISTVLHTHVSAA